MEYRVLRLNFVLWVVCLILWFRELFSILRGKSTFIFWAKECTDIFLVMLHRNFQGVNRRYIYTRTYIKPNENNYSHTCVHVHIKLALYDYLQKEASALTVSNFNCFLRANRESYQLIVMKKRRNGGIVS